MKSSITKLNDVTFPEYTGERVYMTKFTKASGLPSQLKRWQSTIDAMLEKIDIKHEPIFIMIDQARVKAGTTHRRPGIHIDGIWVPGDNTKDNIGMHSTRDGHKINGVAQNEDQALVLASNVRGCAAYLGEYHDQPQQDGSFTNINVGNLDKIELSPYSAWVGSAMTTLHESIPVPYDSYRTLVRLNICDWMP